MTLHTATCKVPDCNGITDVPGTARGYCIRHYWREQRTGFPECGQPGCDQPIGKYGAAGFCFRHAPDWIER